MNYQQLKDFCNSLKEEQLQLEVKVYGEEETFSQIEAEVLEEDHLYCEDIPELGSFPRSLKNELLGTDEDHVCEVSMPALTPMLNIIIDL